MHNPVLFLAGFVTAYAAGTFAVMSMFDTSGRRWVTILGGLCAVLAVAGLLLAIRAFGIGWVGAP